MMINKKPSTRKKKKQSNKLWNLRRFNRKTSALVFILLFAAVGSYLLFTSQAAVTGADRYGFSNGSLMWLSSADQGTKMDQMKAMGSRWIRSDLRWDMVQNSGPTSYNWTSHDNIVNNAKARGMRVLFIIAFTPSWARPSGCMAGDKCAPANPQDYANFAAAAAAHYGPMGVHDYEIWNEPNIPQFWAPTPSAAQYTAILKLAYAAIHAADAAANVLTGGTSPSGTGNNQISPTDFLAGIYANGGKGYFDNVAHHPYCYYPGFNCPTQYASWSAWSQMQDTPVNLRGIMTANGDSGKQIWATEFGAPTKGTDSLTEAQQAQMVTDAYQKFSSYSWAGPLFWYTDKDSCTNTGDRECWFGLIRGDGSHKPGFDAYVSSSTSAGSSIDTVLPVTSITTPTNGATVSGAIQVKASASDNLGVVKVEFYLDNSLSWTESDAPYCYQGDDGSVCKFWDTTKIANGNHVFYTKAYDAAGNTGTSPAITINVNNAAPPTIATYTISGTVTASNGGAVLAGAKVSLYNGSTTVTTTTNSDGYYSFSKVINGSYTLSLSRKRYRPQSLVVTVTDNNVTQNVTLIAR
jgi:polysaccharide biosynthesis protein PslG